MRPEQPAREDTSSSRPDSTMHQVPGLRTKQIRWHSTPRPRSQPTFGHILNLKIAHSARRIWKESLFVMDSFTGPVHGSGQTGTQLIRCWNSGIQLRARDREFGLGCTLRTRRRPPSPRLNALQVSTTLLTTTRRSCPSGYPHLPPVWERRNHSTSEIGRPSSKQGPTLSTMRLNCGALQTQRRDEILPLRQDGSNGSPEQKPQAGHDPGGLGLTEKAKTHHSSILGCRVVRSDFWMTGKPSVTR